MSKTRELPASRDAERAILGAILLDNCAYYQTERLSADDFNSDEHRRIWLAMVSIAEDKKPIDFVTLCEFLIVAREDHLTSIEYVTSLTDGLPRVKNISQYVDIVIEKSRSRKLIFALGKALNQAYEGEGTAEEIIESTDRSLLEIQTQKKSEPKKLCDILPEADKELGSQYAIDQEQVSVGLTTGLEKLDRFTTGYRKREVTVIAAETSDGKTALMRQSIIANCLQDKRILVFSREVSRVSLALDLKAFVSEVSAGRVRDARKMDMLERQKIRDVNDLLKKWALWIDDSRDIHIDEAVYRSRKLIRQEGVQGIFADYAQLFRGTGKNSTEQMEDVCEGFWGLADSENVPLIVLSQLNRGEGHKKQRPTLRRLKNASRIEQDAHCLICPYQPEDDRGERQPKQSELVILKQRHGATGVLHVEFDRDTLMFKDRENNYKKYD